MTRRAMLAAAAVTVIALTITAAAVVVAGADGTGLPPATGDDYLNAIACPSLARCWAVGQRASAPGGDQLAESRSPLLEEWAGGRWHTVPAPTTRGGGEALQAIACPGARDCWAVGGSSSTGPLLIARWSGAGWQAVPSPGVRDGELTGIACPSAADCWAVGATITPAGRPGAILEHWDGREWRRLPGPPGGLSPEAIACPSTARCWVTGSGAGGADLLENGRWQPARLPSAPGANADLPGFSSVACSSPSDCWAVGDTQGLQPDHGKGGGPAPAQFASIPSGPRHSVNLIDHWDGRAWQPATHALPPRAVVGAAACAGAECWLLGWTGSAGRRPLVLRRVAGAWVPASGPGLSRPADFTALACFQACWAVGGLTPGAATTPATVQVAR